MLSASRLKSWSDGADSRLAVVESRGHLLALATCHSPLQLTAFSGGSAASRKPSSRTWPESEEPISAKSKMEPLPLASIPSMR